MAEVARYGPTNGSWSFSPCERAATFAPGPASGTAGSPWSLPQGTEFMHGTDCTDCPVDEDFARVEIALALCGPQQHDSGRQFRHLQFRACSSASKPADAAEEIVDAATPPAHPAANAYTAANSSRRKSAFNRGVSVSRGIPIGPADLAAASKSGSADHDHHLEEGPTMSTLWLLSRTSNVSEVTTGEPRKLPCSSDQPAPLTASAWSFVAGYPGRPSAGT